jgi:chemotaxis protein methyltransferase CheR
MTASTLQASTPTRSLPEALGLPLGAYRRDHVHGCVMRTMRREGVADVAGLVELIDSDPDVRTRLRRAITVATTGLFRDPNQLRWIDREIMPAVTGAASEVRAWSAGCAAGEEAFTLAMMLEWRGLLERSQVIGSDILSEALEEAESGVVGGARIPEGLRGRVTWDLRDLVSDGPLANGVDIALCRNVLSFMTPVAADAVARTLVESLTIGGVLIVGSDERVEAPVKLGLTPIAPSAYRRIR